MDRSLQGDQIPAGFYHWGCRDSNMDLCVMLQPALKGLQYICFLTLFSPEWDEWHKVIGQHRKHFVTLSPRRRRSLGWVTWQIRIRSASPACLQSQSTFHSCVIARRWNVFTEEISRNALLQRARFKLLPSFYVCLWPQRGDFPPLPATMTPYAFYTGNRSSCHQERQT